MCVAHEISRMQQLRAFDDPPCQGSCRLGLRGAGAPRIGPGIAEAMSGTFIPLGPQAQGAPAGASHPTWPYMGHRGRRKASGNDAVSGSIQAEDGQEIEPTWRHERLQSG